VVVDGRGAYLGTASYNDLWQYYESDIKDTALLVKAETLAGRSYTEMDKLLRWLRNSRSKDGSWGDTNNTVTVLDALVDYLQASGETKSNFKLDLTLDGKNKAGTTFDSKTILDTMQAFMPTSDLTPNKLSVLQFNKQNLNNLPNGYYYDMSLKYYLPIDTIAPRDEGFAVERELYALDDRTGKTPVETAKVGQVLRGHLKITVGAPRNFVAVESFIPAGMELVNFNLATSDQTLNQNNGQNQQHNPTVYGDYTSGSTVLAKPVKLARPGFFARVWQWILHLFRRPSSGTPAPVIVGDLPDDYYSGQELFTQNYTPDFTEYHDDRLMLFSQRLDPGVYEYDYYVRALIPGKFQHLPAVASELYTPENFGRTRGEYFNITQ